MKKMLIIDSKENKQKILSFFKRVENDLSLSAIDSMHITCYEKLTPINEEQLQTSDLVVIEINQFKQYFMAANDALKKIKAPIIIATPNMQNIVDQWNEDEKKQLAKVVDERFQNIVNCICFDDAPERYYPFFISLLKNISQADEMNASREQLIKIYHDSSQMVKLVEKQFLKIKSLHESSVPKRMANIKGLNIYSKFGVGENGGGEFFDVLYQNKKLLVFLSSCQSYIHSSAIIGQIPLLKKEKNFDQPFIKKFVTNLYHEILQMGHQAGTVSQINLLVGIIDTKNLQFEGMNFGHSLGMSNFHQNITSNDFTLHESFFDKASFNLKLKRGEKIIFISPGVRKNSQDLIDGRPLMRFLQKQIEGPPQETLNELFFQLRKNFSHKFFHYDASSVIIEVGQNVLIQT